MATQLNSEHERLFEEGLQRTDPTSGLMDAVRRLLNQPGERPHELLNELKAFRGVLQAQGRESDEDVVLELMDFLVGWSSPHMDMSESATLAPRGGAENTTEDDSGNSVHDVPTVSVRIVFPGTSGGIWADRPAAATLRDLNFPLTAVPAPTVAILDLTGVLPTPGVLEDYILPLAQRIRGGLYGQLMLVVRTHDTGVADFVDYLAKAHHLAMFVILSSPTGVETRPVGDLTSTDQTTLNIVAGLGGQVTASELARDIGIGVTAAGNRLVNLAKKGYIYRISPAHQKGDRFMVPLATIGPLTPAY